MGEEGEGGEREVTTVGGVCPSDVGVNLLYSALVVLCPIECPSLLSSVSLSDISGLFMRLLCVMVSQSSPKRLFSILREDRPA